MEDEMLSFIEYLSEHVISIGINSNHEHLRNKHHQEIHDLIQKSYSGVEGGYGGHGSGTKKESDSIHDDIHSSLIKAIKRNGKITAVNLYKDRHGRKSIAVGTDGTDQGKKDLLKIKLDDDKMERSWGEVSGKMEHLANKLGSPKVPNSKAAKLIGKDVETDPDGEHYTRDIGGSKKRKVIVGFPKENQ
jgi:hypothetical protein